MKIEKVNINNLVSPDYNPREIMERDMERLKNSIQEFGYVDPIIVNDVNNHIVGGNQRFLAMKELGYDEVEVVYVHEEDLNREKALNIALNKISGDWDNQKLISIFEDFELQGFDVDLTGFSDLEITSLKLENDVEYYEEDFSDDDLEDKYEEPSIEIRVCPKCGFEDQLVNFKKKGD